jgi:DNA-binding transcriptional LysR family regulator
VTSIAAAQLLANDSAGHVQMVLAGLGIGQLYRPTIKTYLESGALVPILQDWTTATAPISALYPPSKPSMTVPAPS